MSLDGAWVPATPAERTLMRRLHADTREAHLDGVSRVRIAALLAFMASAALDPDEEGHLPELPTDTHPIDEGPVDGVICPVCGAFETDPILSMGGAVTLGCGCGVSFEDFEDEVERAFLTKGGGRL